MLYDTDTITPETVFLLAFMRAHLDQRSPKKREKELRRMAQLLANWEQLPAPIRRPQLAEARKDALRIFNNNVAALIGV